MKVADVGVNDVNLDGTWVSSLGGFVTAWNVPPVPNTRDAELELPGMVGMYDAGTEVSRLDVTMQLGFYSTQGEADLRAKVRTLVGMLDPRNGYIPVYWKSDPDYYLMLKLTSTSGSSILNVNPANADEVACTVDLQFKAADPHWYQVSQPYVTPPDVVHGSPIGISNPGGAPSPMVAKVTATSAVSGGFNIQIGAAKMGLTGALNVNDVVIFNTDIWLVTLNGATAVDRWTGDFIQVPPGLSQVSIDKAGLSLSLTYSPRWLA